ncbi:hypothetical protein APHAL10511_006008 [Amanita phalloides]|nr:hypothetical protein APHAL10511_006008 [Amanita phalloides]
MSASDNQSRQETFQKLKAICVPLMGTSLLTPATVPGVSALVSDLMNALQKIDSPTQLTPSLISYIFFPLSTILRRNPPSAIPDQLLEKIFMTMTFLCDNWWWTCEMAVWEQVFMLCGAVIGNVESKGKGKDRDDETKKAAAHCLFALLRDRTDSEALQRLLLADKAQSRRAEFVEYAQNARFVPILGQTLNSFLQLLVAEPFHLNLQLISLKLTYLLVDVYAPDHLVPSVLPGVVSTMTKVALGTSVQKGWANGEVVAGALKVMQSVVVKAIADNLCIRDGALSHAESLEALAELVHGKLQVQQQQNLPPYATARTSSWLRGTSSQVHIAVNSLRPLLSHPTPSAHIALCNFSSTVLEATPLSLPQTQPALLSYLLSLSTHDLPSISSKARNCLLHLFSKQSATEHVLLRTLMQITRDTLQRLPQFIAASSDSNVEHAAKLITAVSLLSNDRGSSVHLISSGIGKLLGPTGAIEKWGWSLLSVLELAEPLVTVTQTSVSQLMLENDPHASNWPSFPTIKFRNLTLASATEALEQMFRCLGRAGGDGCLFSVEWFMDVALSGMSSNSATAMWCACRLLEGVAAISITEDPSNDSLDRQNRSLEKLARELAKNVAESWDARKVESGGAAGAATKIKEEEDRLVPVEHIRGVKPISETLNIIHAQPVKTVETLLQPVLHRALSLQLLAITAGILQSQSSRLFIYTLYPILHSLTSANSYLSLTALATLKYVTIMTSYASPANLLLSNFDYALDSVSRRLTRRWLDANATKVLIILVRLVGSDVVERAIDVVEECFDRLDDFHEYPFIVEGLVEVLDEVVTVIRPDDIKKPNSTAEAEQSVAETSGSSAFLQWHQNRLQENDQTDTADHGPGPRKAWGTSEVQDAASVSEDVAMESDSEKSPTPVQALTKQIVTRSVYFLTQGSPIIRTRILKLLSSSAAVLPESALMPSIHSAWPYILNRLSDNEPFVISAAAALIEALTTHAGNFMFRRIWDDVWPRFRTLLDKLTSADSQSALARRGYGMVGTESAYTHSHRLYRSVICTMTAAIKGVQPHEASMWQVTLAFRRFLSQHAHEELQACARKLYLAIAVRNVDVVWLALTATSEDMSPVLHFLHEDKWKIGSNLHKILD